MKITLGVKFLALAMAIIFVGAGCATGSNIADGGLYKSVDRGNKWEPKNDIYAIKGQVVNFASADINVLAVDTAEHKSLWLGTMNNGVLFSFNGGEAWQQATDAPQSGIGLTTARINGLTIDPLNGCVVYATIYNSAGKSHLVRTTNCGRSWGLLYTNELAEEQLLPVTVNPQNNLQLFLGDSAGNLFRSDNAGTSWLPIKRFDYAVRTIVVHPKNKNLVYVGLKKGGLWRSADGGQSWAATDLKKFRGAEEVYNIVIDPTKNDSLLIGTNYGILRSDDGATSWEAFQLLTAPNETQIISLALNPMEPQRLYYGTPKGFYRSEDGGKTWATKKVPTTRVIKALYVDATSSGETIWLAAWNAPKK